MNEIKLGAVITAKRREKGVTQDELAAYIGVTKASVSKWETGQSFPDVTFLPLLASYFDVTIDQLLDYSPQMESDDVKKLYLKLAEDFAEKPFEDVIEECGKIVKKYYSCYHLLLRIATLYLNHATLANDAERINQIMAEAIRLCERIKENSRDVHLIESAVSCHAVCLLALGDGKAVLNLLGEFPQFDTTASDSIHISQAYRLSSNHEKAKEVLQAQVYADIMNTFNSLISVIECNLDDLKTAETGFLRAEKLAVLFNMRKLNPNNMAILYALAAQMYQAGGFPEKAIEALSKYADVCVDGFFPFVLGCDDFFGRIENWLSENSHPTPRSDEIIKESMMNDVMLSPAFEPLRGNPEYDRLVQKLKDFIGGM